MPTDAKCGLLVGVGLVVVVAVLFFQKDPPPTAVSDQTPSPAAVVKPPAAGPEHPERSSPAPGRPASRTANDDPQESRLP